MKAFIVLSHYFVVIVIAFALIEYISPLWGGEMDWGKEWFDSVYYMFMGVVIYYIVGPPPWH